MMHVFSVRDLVADRYGQPIFLGNTEEALRAFKGGCENPESDFHKHPTDYVMVHIGFWDEQVGDLEGVEPRIIASATQYVEGVHVHGEIDEEKPMPARFQQLELNSEVAK